MFLNRLYRIEDWIGFAGEMFLGEGVRVEFDTTEHLMCVSHMISMQILNCTTSWGSYVKASPRGEPYDYLSWARKLTAVNSGQFELV